jgi:hypothetical protein
MARHVEPGHAVLTHVAERDRLVGGRLRHAGSCYGSAMVRNINWSRRFLAVDQAPRWWQPDSNFLKIALLLS